jgi:hypothetical protein
VRTPDRPQARTTKEQFPLWPARNDGFITPAIAGHFSVAWELHDMPKPLAGLRVLELARILAGPWAGQILADLGADVVKVERKGAGDDTRGWGPPFVEGKDGKHIGSAYFHGANRGKRSIEIDFDSDEGRRIVRKLAARSDVLIENFKVGGLAKFGLDYKSLAPENPRLIYCSVFRCPTSSPASIPRSASSPRCTSAKPPARGVTSTTRWSIPPSASCRTRR